MSPRKLYCFLQVLTFHSELKELGGSINDCFGFFKHDLLQFTSPYSLSFFDIVTFFLFEDALPSIYLHSLAHRLILVFLPFVFDLPPTLYVSPRYSPPHC